MLDREPHEANFFGKNACSWSWRVAACSFTPPGWIATLPPRESIASRLRRSTGRAFVSVKCSPSTGRLKSSGAHVPNHSRPCGSPRTAMPPRIIDGVYATKPCGCHTYMNGRLVSTPAWPSPPIDATRTPTARAARAPSAHARASHRGPTVAQRRVARLSTSRRSPSHAA